MLTRVLGDADTSSLSLTHDLKPREGEVPSVGGIREETDGERERKRKREWKGVSWETQESVEDERCRQMGDHVRICVFVFGFGFVIFSPLRLCVRGSKEGI